MELKDLLNNHLLINAMAAWAAAQIIKTILYAATNKTLDWERLFGDGGMPSGHSATVTSVAVMCALLCGTGSAAFAISAIVSIKNFERKPVTPILPTSSLSTKMHTAVFSGDSVSKIA